MPTAPAGWRSLPKARPRAIAPPPMLTELRQLPPSVPFRVHLVARAFWRRSRPTARADSFSTLTEQPLRRVTSPRPAACYARSRILLPLTGFRSPASEDLGVRSSERRLRRRTPLPSPD